MSNALNKNTQNDKLGFKFMEGYDADTVTLNTVNRTMIPKGSINNTTGTTYSVKKPHQWRTVRSAAGDLTSTNPSDIVSATATATTQDFFSELVQWELIQEAIELNQLDEILGGITSKMSTDIEVDFNAFMLTGGAHSLGDPTLAVDQWSDIAQCGTLAKDMGWAPGNTYAQITPSSRQELADTQSGLSSGSDDLVNNAWNNARIGRQFAGVQTYTSNTLAQHDAGTYGAGAKAIVGTPTQTYIAAKDTYQSTFTISGFPNSQAGALKKGDVIKIAGRLWTQLQTKNQAAGLNGAGHEYTGTVAADVTSTAGGQVTVVVNGPAIVDTVSGAANYNTLSTAIAAADVVTIVSGAASGSNIPNMFYHKNAFGFLSVELPKIHNQDSKIMNHNGMSFRMHKGGDFRSGTQEVRFDLFPAYVNYNSLLAGRFFGTA